jgi:hypothetical protein
MTPIAAIRIKRFPYGYTMLKAAVAARHPIPTSLPEVPMNTHDELLLWHALHRLEVTYWYDVDFNEGRTAHEFFTPDGVKVVGHNRFEGREEIRKFYEWRARQTGSTAVRRLGVSGVKAVRHLITNLYVASSSERCATVLGMVSFYGGVTYPTHRQSLPPIMVADLITECMLGKDNAWRFKSHTVRPVFMSNAPPSMMINSHFLKARRGKPAQITVPREYEP